MLRTRPKDPTRETPQTYAARLKEACREVNDTHDVAGLCRDEFLKRVQLLVERQGDRIPK